MVLPAFRPAAWGVALMACLILAPGLSRAEPPITAEAFEALTTGRTMTWSEFGTAYGVEEYLPGRRVRWTVLGDTCVTGHWYPQGDAICFEYEHRDTPACWYIRQDGGTLTAADTDNPPGTPPVIIAETTAPMACFGPDVGA
jgi:hypothetical protein